MSPANCRNHHAVVFTSARLRTLAATGFLVLTTSCAGGGRAATSFGPDAQVAPAPTSGATVTSQRPEPLATPQLRAAGRPGRTAKQESRARDEGRVLSNSFGGFEVSGTLTASAGMESRDLALPATMTQSWQSSTSQLLLLGETKNYPLGCAFGLDSPHALWLRSFWITQPGSNFKNSLTYGFPLQRELPFASLRLGESATAATEHGRFQVELRRTQAHAWVLNITPTHTGVGEPWFTSGTFTFAADSNPPEWQSLRIGIDATTPSGRLRGDIELRRVADRPGPATANGSP